MIDFNSLNIASSASKAKKNWTLNLVGGEQLPPMSDSLKAMVQAACTFGTPFTLEELAVKAEEYTPKGKWSTKTDIGPDYHAIGYTHRPKLMKMKVIVEEKIIEVEA